MQRRKHLRFSGNVEDGIKMKAAAFFDVDNTLVKGQTQELMVKFFYKKKMVKFGFLVKILFWFLLYKAGFLSRGFSLMKKAYKLVKGMNVEEFQIYLQELFEKEIKLRIYPQAIERINFHKEKGHEIILISKSCKLLVDIIKNYLQVPIALATELEAKNGFLTGELKGNIMHGEEKIKAIENLAREKNYNLKESYAYSDHHSDIQLLKIVGHPIAVNPDKKLKNEALKNHWSIVYWKL